jgi:hypothetical protein
LPAVVTVNSLAPFRLTVVLRQVSSSASASAAVPTASAFERMLPKALISVSTPAVRRCSRLSGWRSMASNCVMMELTSRPLPTPRDCIVAIAPLRHDQPTPGAAPMDDATAPPPAVPWSAAV